MGLVPMYLGAVGFTVREPHQRQPLEFPPATSAVPNLEAVPFADGEVSGYGLDVHDFADKLEIHLHGPKLTTGEPARKGCLTFGIGLRRATAVVFGPFGSNATLILTTTASMALA